MKPSVRCLALVLALAASPRAAADGPWAGAPDPFAAGRKLGRAFLEGLEREGVELPPGPFLLDLLGEVPRRARLGLEQGLAGRGFAPASPSEIPVLRLRLLCELEPGGGRLTLAALAPPLGPWTVRWEEKPWVEDPLAAPRRLQGPWEADPAAAVDRARGEARAGVQERLRPLLPWRPWKETALREGSREPGLVIDAFLEREQAGSVALWREWLLLAPEGIEQRIVRERLRTEDRRWFSILAGAGLAGFALAFLAARLDWAARGYFTWRIRTFCFLLWTGVCAGLVLVL